MATHDDDRPSPDDEATRLATTDSTDKQKSTGTTHPTTDPGKNVTEALTAISEELANGTSNVVAVGSVLKNRFVLEEMLGRGGMGVVYKARDLRKVEAMDRDPYIAVKVLSKDFQANPDSFIALQRESKKAQQLAHPNIVTVYDFDRDGPNVFMTMELLEGEPLDQLIRRLRPATLPTQQALSIIEQMARALAYAHSENIVHSDFKPGNVFLTSKSVVKVVDFGIARAAKSADRPAEDATVFDPGSLGALTPTYASCEMLEYGEPDPRDD
ncbi:MAG: serine/threonine-protein kinase, partial [Candidatus Thiodiazotropha sp.]